MRPLVVVVGLLLGCGHAPPPLPVVLGPYLYDRQDQLFSVTLEAVRGAGYDPVVADAAAGRIVAPARLRIRGDEPPTLVVQLYTEGWIRCDAELPAEARAGHRERAARETEALAMHVLGVLARHDFETRRAT